MKKLWTAEEVESLRKNAQPVGRSLESCYVKASKMGISFSPRFRYDMKKLKEKAAALTGPILDEMRRTCKVRQTARKFGVSYTTVTKICRDHGVPTAPTSVELRGECIQFEGKLYSWDKHGYYWKCTTGNRESLARVLYERAHGPIKGRKVVVHKDGDRYNLDPSNLVCKTPSEQTKERYDTDPMFRASCVACLALGRLKTQINETINPESRAERIGKMWKTRRQKETLGDGK